MGSQLLRDIRQWVSGVMVIVFTLTSVWPSYAQSVMNLPAPGTMVALSPAFHPAVLTGMKVYPDDPFRFDFILDQGDLKAPQDQLKEESSRLIRYFLAALTIPEKDLWVNLSPYEKDRIVPDAFGQTEMGRDLLAQDYILKQITSSLIYPESEVGKSFWQKVYAQVQAKYGSTDVPVDTFNKVWITPDKAEVYEDKGVAYIGETHLKVMLDADYLASQANIDPANNTESAVTAKGMAKDVTRDMILPILEKEVNEGESFALLRQVYQSLVLAVWYKKRLKDSILSQVYMDRGKVAGVNIADVSEVNKIWAQYVEAFKKGAFNYIKEEQDQYSQEVIPRKYFSGGVTADNAARIMTIRPLHELLNKVGAAAKKVVLVTVALTAFGSLPSVAKAETVKPAVSVAEQYLRERAEKKHHLLASRTIAKPSVLTKDQEAVQEERTESMSSNDKIVLLSWVKGAVGFVAFIGSLINVRFIARFKANKIKKIIAQEFVGKPLDWDFKYSKIFISTADGWKLEFLQDATKLTLSSPDGKTVAFSPGSIITLIYSEEDKEKSLNKYFSGILEEIEDGWIKQAFSRQDQVRFKDIYSTVSQSYFVHREATVSKLY
ncbi:MAG: hypothetical protein WCI27_08700, partial [Candidatus Omnitrophota bacterium]